MCSLAGNIVDNLRERVNCHASWQPALRCGCCRLTVVTCLNRRSLKSLIQSSQRAYSLFPSFFFLRRSFNSIPFSSSSSFSCLTSLFYGDSVVVDYSCATETITESSLSEVITIVDSVLRSRALFIIIDRQRTQFNRICDIYHIFHVR